MNTISDREYKQALRNLESDRVLGVCDEMTVHSASIVERYEYDNPESYLETAGYVWIKITSREQLKKGDIVKIVNGSNYKFTKKGSLGHFTGVPDPCSNAVVNVKFYYLEGEGRVSGVDYPVFYYDILVAKKRKECTNESHEANSTTSSRRN